MPVELKQKQKTKNKPISIGYVSPVSEELKKGISFPRKRGSYIELVSPLFAKYGIPKIIAQKEKIVAAQKASVAVITNAQKASVAVITNNSKKITIGAGVVAETISSILDAPITFDIPKEDICNMPIETPSSPSSSTSEMVETPLMVLDYFPDTPNTQKYVSIYTGETVNPSIQADAPTNPTYLEIMHRVSKNPTRDKLMFLDIINDVHELQKQHIDRDVLTEGARNALYQTHIAKVNTLIYLDRVVNREVGEGMKHELDIKDTLNWYLKSIHYYAPREFTDTDAYIKWRTDLETKHNIESENWLRTRKPEVKGLSDRQIQLEAFKNRHSAYLNKMSDNISGANNETNWDEIWAKREREKSQEFYIEVKKQIEIEKTRIELSNIKEELNESCSNIINRCNIALKNNIERTIPYLENMKKETVNYMKKFEEICLSNKWLTLSAGLTIGGALLYRFGSKNMLNKILKGIKVLFVGSGSGSAIPPYIPQPEIPSIPSPSISIPPQIPSISIPPQKDNTGYGIAVGMVSTKVLQKIMKK